MIDLETFGTQEDSVIFQISGVVFDPLQVGLLGAEFNSFVDIASQPERIIHADTLKWWLGQDSKLLRDLVFADTKHTLEEALRQLRLFCKDNKVHYAWANSPSFDIALLRHASRPYGKDAQFPVQFWKERDVRTMKSLVEITDDDIDKEMRFIGRDLGMKHDARVDVIRQAIQVQLVYKHLGIKE